MAKRLKFDESGDSDDLQALFDSISGSPAAAAVVPPRLEVGSVAASSGGGGGLQALFDSVASEYATDESDAAAPDSLQAQRSDNVFNRIGVMTRQLHDTLRELGYDRNLQEAAHAIPDARQRLTYIAEISPRPVLFIHGEKAHSRYFSETAYAAAAEPKELLIVPGANHVDLYDRPDKIPFDKIADFFAKNLK